MIHKLFITPWFGPLPEWWPQYAAQMERLREHGYEWLIERNLEAFQERCLRKLGVRPPIVAGGSKSHDLRPMLGYLYEAELRGYDFWGFTDFDVVYGRVQDWVTDEFLSKLDVHSNHHSYMCGPWSLLRNTAEARNLFLFVPGWREKVLDPNVNGWGEHGWSREIESKQHGLRVAYTYWQGNDRDLHPEFLEMRDGGKLWHPDIGELTMFHFRQTKRWPL